LATDKVEKLELKKLRSYYTEILHNLQRKENERLFVCTWNADERKSNQIKS
jgi:hypothetical protein